MATKRERKRTTEDGHPIQVVARRTGLTPDVIRVWERRYRAVRPQRTAGSRRLYSDSDVERLLLLRRATLAGRRIGDVAGLDDATLVTLVAEDERAEARALRPNAPRNRRGDGATHVEDCLEACRRLDAGALEAALGRASVELSLPALVEDVVAPLMTRLGDDWRAGESRVMHEHLASAMVRSLLGSLNSARQTPPGASTIVVSTPVGQLHELGALTVALFAVAEGWNALYLGPNLPAEELAAAARVHDARAVALSLVHPAGDPGVADELCRVARLLDGSAVLLAGGRALASYTGTLDSIGAQRIEDLAALRVKLETLRAA